LFCITEDGEDREDIVQATPFTVLQTRPIGIESSTQSKFKKKNSISARTSHKKWFFPKELQKSR